MKTVFEFEHMKLEKDGKTAWITLTGERYLNAINHNFVDQLRRCGLYLVEDEHVRAVIIRGQGRAFSSGLNLKEYAANQISMDFFNLWEEALHLFELMEKLVIAGVHGYCLGGGLQLTLVCDIRISTPDCQFSLPALQESLIPGLGIWRLSRHVGMGRAKKLILGGQRITGQEAYEIGLVDYVVTEQNFFAHVDRIAEQYLRNFSMGARMSKLLINETFEMGYDESLERYLQLQKRAYHNQDAEEAKRAYLAKREPSWQ
jgi:enoyl-CoA hydratase/carnithine racemase